MWSCPRSYHQGVKEYECTFKMEQHNWGVIRGKDTQLDLNDPRVKVVQTSGQRTVSLMESPCKECDGIMIVLYQQELKDLKKRSTFKCKHGVKLTS